MRRQTALLLLIVLQLTLVVGCNPYRAIDPDRGDRAPKSIRDSSALVARANLAFPRKDTVRLPGTVVRYAVVTVDSARLKALDKKIDSMLAIPGFNIDSLKAEIRRQCVPETTTIVDSCTPEIIEITDQKQVDEWRLKYGLKNDQWIASQDKLRVVTLKSANKDKFVWGFWGLLIAICGMIGVWAYMKFHQPIKIG
jgi:hypothetical protein